MGSYLRALRAPTPLVAWPVLAALFAVSGSFGGGEYLAFVPRTAFWLLIVGTSLAFGIAVRVAIECIWSVTDYLAASLAASVLSCAVLGFALPPLTRWMLDLPAAEAPSPAVVAVTVLLLGGGITLLRHFLQRDAPPVAGAGEARPKLLGRLPDEVGGALLHLSVSDHYVDVATDRGTGRVLMRFSDAMEEVAEVDGLRVHRSHWVARAAVAAVERCNGRTFLRLTNGTRVPVSRAYEGAVASLGG
ncbi:MAG: LytTR family transcriptional regulator [Paracoccaceae bacterium]|nr:LytTR family transcriptional regulator [Paracoccaceae bacterium]